MIWIVDDADDLINLDNIEYISVSPISEEAAEPDTPFGHTHQLLAINSDQESYRLFSGTEEEVKQARKELAERLGAIGR